MKVIKRLRTDIKIEQAHGGSGSRKMLAGPEHLVSEHFEAFTYGYLPAGQSFDWHDHKNTEEIMIVMEGEGEVHDKDGQYAYAPGDVFIFPANIEHKIYNPTNQQHEMIFVRMKL
jgi:quercetin dioxygenase-like cupin family protein